MCRLFMQNCRNDAVMCLPLHASCHSVWKTSCLCVAFYSKLQWNKHRNVVPQRPTNSVWKGTAGAKDKSILTTRAPEIFHGKQNLKCFLHKYFSSKTAEFFLFQTEVHTSLSSTKSNVWGVRNRKWKGKKNQMISAPHLMLRTYYQNDAAEETPRICECFF